MSLDDYYDKILLDNREKCRQILKTSIKECLKIMNEEEAFSQMLMLLCEFGIYFDIDVLDGRRIEDCYAVAFWNMSADIEDMKDWQECIWKDKEGRSFPDYEQFRQ